MDVRFCEGRNHRREARVRAAGSARVRRARSSEARLRRIFFLLDKDLHGCRQSGVRRDKPACCRGCKSPTGKENSDSILASSLAGGSVSCPLKRRPEVPVGRAIELRKADGSGCRLLSEMEEGNTAATSARVAVGPA